jgi:hypothetical protein
VAEKSFTERRKEAEERSDALLRAIVPESEWRYQQTRAYNGRLGERVPVCLEFTGQHGTIYRINFNATSENIRILSGPWRGRGLCGGPYAYNDYVRPTPGLRRSYPQMDDRLWTDARNRAYRANEQPLVLPPADIWLGQYLALKYDEDEFLDHANRF